MPSNARDIICAFCKLAFMVPFGWVVPMHEGKPICFSCELALAPHADDCDCFYCKVRR